MCDMAVAAEHANFGLPEVKIGVFPAQVLSVLQHLAGPRHIAEMCITGEPIDARRAEPIGLVNYVVPAAQLDEKVDWLVVARDRQVAHGDPTRQGDAARGRRHDLRAVDLVPGVADHDAGADRGRQGRPRVVRREARAELERTMNMNAINMNAMNVQTIGLRATTRGPQ